MYFVQSGYHRARSESGYNVTPDGEPADDERAQIIHHEEGTIKQSEVSRNTFRTYLLD